MDIREHLDRIDNLTISVENIEIAFQLVRRLMRLVSQDCFMSELFLPNECELMNEVFQDLGFSFEGWASIQNK